MTITIPFFAALALFSGSVIAGQSAPSAEIPQGQIYQTSTGNVVELDRLLPELVNQRWLMLGENHSNPRHHQIELWLTQSLAAQDKLAAVALEMITPAHQQYIDSIRGNAFSSDLKTLHAEIRWDEYSRWQWQDYGPLISFTLQQSLPLASANIDRDEMMELYNKGSQADLASNIITDEHVTDVLTRQMNASHCMELDGAHLDGMLSIQQIRDWRMGEAINQFSDDGLTVLVAGAQHVRKDIGAPRYIDPSISSQGISIGLLGDNQFEAAEDWQDYYDYIWVTEGVPEVDPCEEMQKHHNSESSQE